MIAGCYISAIQPARMPMINIPKKPTLAVVSWSSLGTPLRPCGLRVVVETTTKAWTRRSR